jgi:hypothetical protein
MRRTKNRALGLVVYASVASTISIAAIACTHDFGAYEASGDGISTSPEGSADGAKTIGTDGSSSGDGAIAPPPDASTVDTGTDAGCATAAMCAATETTCKSACNATLTTCTAQCGGGGAGNPCKTKCKTDHDQCVTTCTTTCHTCAGAACMATCN